MARRPLEVDDDEMRGVPGRPLGVPGVDFLIHIPQAVIVQTIREMVRVRGSARVADVLCETGADPERILLIMDKMEREGEGRLDRRRNRASLFVRR